MPFRAIAEYTYDWETWVDPQGRVRWVNSAVERITGYSVADCLADTAYPLSLVVPSDRPLVDLLLKRAAAGESGNHREFRILRKDGSVRWGAMSFQPIHAADGEPLGYRTSVRDVDDQKKMEAELHAAVRRAEVASRAKSEFLANVSHELRTPLQSILGYAELLAEADLPAQLQRYAQTVLEQGKLLEHLVLDLLDSSAAQAGQLSVRHEEVLLHQVAAEVMRALRPLAVKRKLSLACDVPVLEPVVGDRRRLVQVLMNLVGNAIKFTNAGQVRVSVGAAGEGVVVVHVDDTGPGIAPDVDVFEPFQRGSEVAIGPPGVGLGLAISRRFCRAMGGDLWAGESPLGGARLTLKLPTADASQVAAARSEPRRDPTAAGAPRNRCRALVVDDVASARGFLREALGALGVEVACADSADAAYGLADAGSFDLVLLDLHMPGVDGWACVQGLRARLGTGVLIVALSAAPPAQVEARLPGSGFDLLRSKPIDLSELRALVQRAAGSAMMVPAAGLRTRSGEPLSDWLHARIREELPRLLQSLGDALARDARVDIRQVAHDLHGVFGLLQLADACERARAVQAADEGQLVARARELLRAGHALARELAGDDRA